MTTRAGIVAVVGRPNAGKSTLLNRLVGERLAITSPKPQSTRTRVVGLISDAETQIVLLDTPGLLEPAYELQRSMRAVSLRALDDADVVVHVMDLIEHRYESLTDAVGAGGAPLRAPVIAVLNKADLFGAARGAALAVDHPVALQLSAKTGDGVLALLEAVRALLPVGPFLYDPEDLSTQNLRFFAAEMVRETALEQLDDEVPYSVACEVEEYREGSSPVYIRVVLHVERESQKRILIGAGGARIKAIGTSARSKIEPLAGGPVYLDLRVKVLANWRRNGAALARLGYPLPRTPDARARNTDRKP